MAFVRRIAVLGGFLLPLALAPAWGQGNDPSFRLTNETAKIINQVHVSSSVEAAWGEDRLGSGTIKPEATAAIRVPPGHCVNDIRVVFADGSAAEQRQVNTCTTKDVTFR